MTTTTTYIFDCFGVICEPLVVGWYKEHRSQYGRSDDNFDAMLRDFNLGTITEDDVVEYFYTYKGNTFTQEEILHGIDNRLHINEPLVEILRELKKEGHTLILLTNANHHFFRTKLYIKYPYFTSLFDDIIISSEVKMLKPNKDIFLYTLEQINKKPEEILFIDDTTENVEVAESLGIQGIVYTGVEELKRELGKVTQI